MRLLQSGTARVIDLTFSPDGRALASCSTDGVLILWDIDTGETRVLHEPPLENGRRRFVYDSCQQVAFTPDGRHLLHRSPTDGLRVWDLAENRPARTLLTRTTEVYQAGLAVARVGGLVAANEWVAEPFGNAIHLWDSATWQGRMLYCTSETYSFAGLAFDPTGTRLATNVGVFDTATGDRLLDAHLWGDVLAWSPTAPLIAGAAQGDEIELFHATTGEPLASLPLSESGTPQFAFSPDGAYLAVIDGQVVRAWGTTDWTPQREFEWGIGWLEGLAFSRDGLMAACGGADGRILIWDWDL